MVLIAVEAVPAGSKPPAAVGVRLFTSERHGFGAAAPLSTMASSQKGRAGGSVESYRSWLDTLADQHRPFLQTSCPYALLDLLQRPPYACEFGVSWYVCLRGKTWLPSILLQACYAWQPAKRCLVAISSFGFSGFSP